MILKNLCTFWAVPQDKMLPILGFPGPYKLNGIPLRRVSQTYVIATQTKVDLAGFVVPEKFNDAYFKRKEAKKAEGESVFKESEQVSLHCIFIV